MGHMWTHPALWVFVYMAINHSSTCKSSSKYFTRIIPSSSFRPIITWISSLQVHQYTLHSSKRFTIGITPSNVSCVTRDHHLWQSHYRHTNTCVLPVGQQLGSFWGVGKQSVLQLTITFDCSGNVTSTQCTLRVARMTWIFPRTHWTWCPFIR